MVRQRSLAPAALVVSAFAMALVIVLDTQLGNTLTVASGAARLRCVRGDDDRGTTAAGTHHQARGRRRAAETAVSLLVAPRATGDLWWYALYGRIVAVHHASPYTNSPAHFPHDPLLPFAGHGWAHVPSVYGPLFTGVSALGITRARHRRGADAALLPSPRRSRPRSGVRDDLAAHALGRRGGVPRAQPRRRALPRERRPQRHPRRRRHSLPRSRSRRAAATLPRASPRGWAC